MHPNWRALCTTNIKWKQFVKEGTPSINEKHSSSKYFGNIDIVTGEEAKDFYENIINSDYSKGDKAGNALKECGTTTVPIRGNPNSKPHFNNKERWLNTLMKEAQNNNVEEMEKLLRITDFSVNEQDAYGWTALMVACFAGALDVVQFLLIRGADKNLKDKIGNTCFSLAKLKGQKEILNVLSSGMLLQQGQRDTPKLEKEKVQFYCEVCKLSFKDTSKQQHYTSTVHLFNSKSKAPTSVSYVIPCTNRGYQILVKSGWNENTGLGPEGTGRKFPLKTVLKCDRRGLGGHGAKREKSCVTHFGPGDTKAVNRIAPRTQNRHQREAKLCKDRQKERAWRREFSDPM